MLCLCVCMSKLSWSNDVNGSWFWRLISFLVDLGFFWDQGIMDWHFWSLPSFRALYQQLFFSLFAMVCVIPSPPFVSLTFPVQSFHTSFLLASLWPECCLFCHFPDLKLRDFLIDNETFSDFLHHNVSMPSSAVEELLDAGVSLQQVKSTFNS